MWEIDYNSRVLFGPGQIREIAGIFRWRRLKKIFIVTFNADLPAVKRVQADLETQGIACFIYAAIKGEPDLTAIDTGTAVLKSEGCDGVLAIGGGSVLDAAKAMAMLATNGGNVVDYQMNGKMIAADTLPLVAVPTTAGTGAEATRVSVIYNNDNGLKKSVYSHCMIPSVTILDPEATLGLSPARTAATGIDALSHAIESYVSLNATPVTEMYSLKAMELISRNLVTAVSNGKDITARSNMLLASYLAGCAITAGIGIAHIIAQPLGGILKIPHGEACSIFLPLGMEANLQYSVKKYRKIGETLGITEPGLDDLQVAEGAVAKVKEIIDRVGTPQNLLKYLPDRQWDLDSILEKINAATGHIRCNPRPVDPALVTEILKRAC